MRIDEIEFLPRKQESLSSYVADEVTRLIIDGKITPGTRIKEVDLAKALEISRSPIREAISQLISENVLVRRSNHGVYINFPSRKEWKDICDTRMLIEQYSAKKLIYANDETVINELNKQLNMYANERMKKAPNFKLMRKYDYNFHKELCKFSDNSVILEFWENLHIRGQVIILVEGTNLEKMDGSHNEHKDILEAIKIGNIDLLKRSIEHHLLRTFISYDKISISESDKSTHIS